MVNTVLEADIMEQFKENEFLEHCLEIFVDFCADREYTDYIDPNIPLSVMERRSQLEVRAKKSSVHVSPSQLKIHGRVPPTAELVAAAADVVHNVVAFSRCPVQAWNDQGLFRILFRCASNSRDSAARVSARRAIVAAAAHQCVRLTLAATNDCLYDLLLTLTPTNVDPKTSSEEHAQALLLLACILAEKTASQFVWRTLKEKHADSFFFLILQTLESDDIVLREAGQFCLTRLLQSISKNKYHEKNKFAAYVELFDNLPSPYAPNVDDRLCAGDEGNCLPEYMAEEICKLLMFRFNKLAMDNKMLRKIPEDGWSALCSCLSSLWSVSARGRSYGAHCGGPRGLLAALRALRDHLSVHGKPVQVIRNADHNPTLCTLYWLLTVMDSSMLECEDAKESYVEEGIAISLNRLWPWCMMTEQLRYAVIHLLNTFCNNCPKAWGAMCVCVSGRSLAGELCALLAREAELQSHTRPPLLLLLAMQALTRILDHHHCRAAVIKSEALVVVYKLCVRSRTPLAPVCNACAAAWRAVARHAAGAGALLALRPPVALAPRSLRAALMPALAHAAHHHRTTFLQSAELLELLSGTLLAGDAAETMSAARAVWALAANHHKAKLVLRSAGVSASVQVALQRLRRAPPAAVTERAVQLLTYTNTVLQTT